MRLLGLVLAVAAAPSLAAERPLWSGGYGYRGLTCSAAAIPDVLDAYYGIDLVATRRVPGTGNAVGLGKVSFAPSPYGVSVTDAGEYVHDIELSIDRLKPPAKGVLTAWIASSDLSRVERIGVFDESLRARGRVSWNRFLVVVTLEPSPEPADGWTGPLVLRGMSRSGMMHTMAGHGPFEKEPCAKYGFR